MGILGVAKNLGQVALELGKAHGSPMAATHITAAKSHAAQAVVSSIPGVGNLPVGKLVDGAVTGNSQTFTAWDRHSLDVNHDGHIDFDDASELFHQVSDAGDKSHKAGHAAHASGHTAHATGHAAHASGHAAHAAGHAAHVAGHAAHVAGHVATAGHVAAAGAAGACLPVAAVGAAVSGSIYAGRKFIENDMDVDKTYAAISEDIESTGKAIEKAADDFGKTVNDIGDEIAEAWGGFSKGLFG